MCAITDHDRFSLDLYKTLKSYEGKELLEVLPGVEFSVKFDGKKVIHIVTIFDDKDEEGLKRLEESFVKGIGKEKYIDGAYERDDYFAILKEVGLDFVMIAHQKKTPTSTQKPHKSDVMSLGREAFNELLFMEYFDAYEFRQRDNEIFNKKFSLDNDVKENWANVEGGFKEVTEYSFRLGTNGKLGYEWLEKISEIVLCDRVYLLLEENGMHAKYWIAECNLKVINCIINDTLTLGDYFIVDKKYKWLITENHHEVVQFIGSVFDGGNIDKIVTAT